MGILAVDEISRRDAAVFPQRLLKATTALIGICVATIFAFRSLNDPLWSDELLTTTLLQADSLPKLWSGIAAGIDGNPPLYLTAIWLVMQVTPQVLLSAAVLKLINLGLTVAAIVTLCRFGRRFVSSGACYVGSLLFVTLNDNVVFVAFELRTYALYFLMAALSVLLQQRLIERGRLRDTIMLALAFAGLALVHTFGIAYVACIALAGCLSMPPGERPRFQPMASVLAPAVIVLAAWSPFLFQQLKVAQPYGWMERPAFPDLLETLFASKAAMSVAILEFVCVAAALLSCRGPETFRLRTILSGPQGQPLRYLALLLAGVTGITLACWLVSIALFPLFVPRFFTPQMIAALALHVAFGEVVLRHAVEKRAAVLAIGALLATMMLFNVEMNSAPRRPVCSDDNGSFFETGFVSGDLPVIAESPHVFLLRATYAARGSVYRFPLDWDVVLKYPEHARGNAVDFHIMQGLQAWKPMPSVISTEEIVHSFPQFLVIEQPGRAWFHHLLATRSVVAEKLSATGAGQSSCTLWKVTSVRP